MRTKYTNEDLQNAVKASNSYSDVCRKLGLIAKGGNIETIKRKINILKIDCSHFKGCGWSGGLTFIEYPNLSRKNLEQMLIKDSTTKSYVLKNKLITYGIKKEECECCFNTQWNGHKIPLELHHINGDNKDNRLENLQILCPNCHAQTNNYKGKNIRHNEVNAIYVSKKDDIKEFKCKCCGNIFEQKYNSQIYCSQECCHKTQQKVTKEITKESLINSFIEFKSFVKVGEYFGISDRAICKWFKKYDLPNTKKELEKYINNLE